MPRVPVQLQHSGVHWLFRSCEFLLVPCREFESHSRRSNHRLVVTIFFAVNLRTFVPENPNKLEYSRSGSGVSSEGHALHPLQEQRGNRAVEHV